MLRQHTQEIKHQRLHVSNPSSSAAVCGAKWWCYSVIGSRQRPGRFSPRFLLNFHLFGSKSIQLYQILGLLCFVCVSRNFLILPRTEELHVIAI